MIGGTLPMKEKARMIMTKVVNLISAKMEMGSPMISMYLLGNPDHYTDHKFIPFYWQSFVAEAERAFDSEGDVTPMKVTLIKQKGRIVGVSPVFDYIYRAKELESMSLYEWVNCCSRIKLSKKQELNERDMTTDISFNAADESFNSILTNLSDGPDAHRAKSVYTFLSDHPLHTTHGLQVRKKNPKMIPNFIGATLPRKDQGDINYYFLTMLALFKPWRNGTDLKSDKNQSWNETFNEHSFSEENHKLMSYKI
jgi:hypothetical protein